MTALVLPLLGLVLLAIGIVFYRKGERALGSSCYQPNGQKTPPNEALLSFWLTGRGRIVGVSERAQPSAIPARTVSPMSTMLDRKNSAKRISILFTTA